MIFIVDGTGVEDKDAYEREMGGGFCRQLANKAGRRAWYHRGPTLLGTETTSIALKVERAVIDYRCTVSGANDEVFLAGHSRGGAAVIFAAQALKAQGVRVSAMFLFDAVDRTVNFKSAARVPSNVEVCYHALRDPSLATYYSAGVAAARDKVAKCVGLPVGRRPTAMEDMLDVLLSSPPKPGECAAAIHAARALMVQDSKMKYVMRATTQQTVNGPSIDFGNCGLTADFPKTLVKEVFLGSHGAIGGAPIVDSLAPDLLIQSDRAAVSCVNAWMSSFLCRHGVLQGSILG